MKLTWHNADLKLNAWRTISNRHKPLQLPISNRRLPSSSFARYFFSCSNSSTKSPFTRINFCHHKNNDSSNNQQLSRPSSLIKTSLWMASGVLYCPSLSLVSGYRRCVGGVELSSAFVDSWQDWRRFGRLTINCGGRSLMKRRMMRRGALVIVSEVAGQYEDSFEDVKSQIMNYFTYKAVRTVMNQLYEMNPTQYRWLYDFVVNNKPGDGKRFLRILGKERRELAERVMVTRLHLYAKWVKKCDHAEMYKEISDQNLELMRERLMETVIWPSDDTNTEKVG